MSTEIRPAGAEDRTELAAHPSALPFLENQALLAFEGDRLAAFLFFHRLAADELEILQVETLEPHRRQGIARALLRALRDTQPGNCFLEVRESNKAALRLYRSAGFVDVSVRKAYYSDPPESAIVLKFKLC